MGPYNFEADRDFKVKHAPRLMAMLEACIQSQSFDKEMERLEVFVIFILENTAGTLGCGDRPATLAAGGGGAGGGGSSTATSTGGIYYNGSGGVVRAWGDGSEEEQFFKTHGRKLTFSEARATLQFKRTKKDVARNLIVDILVGAHNSGQEVIGELLLNVSVAASCWLPKHGQDVLSALGIIDSTATTVRVKDELARRYGAAFQSDCLNALHESATANGHGVACLSGQIDNYCKGIQARHLKAKGDGTNFKVISTQSRMFGRAQNTKELNEKSGGYGKVFDFERINSAFKAVDSKGLAILRPAGGSKEAWQLPLLTKKHDDDFDQILGLSWNAHILTLPTDAAAKLPSGSDLRPPQAPNCPPGEEEPHSSACPKDNPHHRPMPSNLAPIFN